MKHVKDLISLYFDDNLNLKGSVPFSDEESDVVQIIKYLDSGVVWNAAACFKNCEICGDFAGLQTNLQDSVWLWPRYLNHYVLKHHVKLPPEFLSHIRKRNYEVDTVAANQLTDVPHNEIDFIVPKIDSW